MRNLARLVLLAALLFSTACQVPLHQPGYMVWVENASAQAIVVTFEADERPASYLAAANGGSGSGPFIFLDAQQVAHQADEIRVYTEDCVELATFPASPGAFLLTVDIAGQLSLDPIPNRGADPRLSEATRHCVT